jgi:bacteriophage N4 adsorption protein B
MSFDHAMVMLLAPLGIALLLSGLDDLTVDIAWAAAWVHRKLRPAASLFPPGPLQLDSAPRNRIAILVPLWHEHEVIARMLEHNFASIRYPDYHIFAGAYPNDDRTQTAVRQAAAKFSQIHLVLCPHDGPTSKADCLNWIYQHVALYEESNETRFDVIVTHDAEDIIHPDELRWINFYAARYDFIQTPVLPLATPIHKFTHGLYCDEFAEYHTRDMPVRPLLGGFVPSAGVGTGYRRDALDRLAEASANRVFEPEALTEDYENGLRMFRLGCAQAFVPLVRSNERRDYCATREFFPQTWSAALRQRTRWVTGIALQTWQRHGWGRNLGEAYWLWRDRKGLIANPLSMAANFLFFYGIATHIWTRATPLAASVTKMTLALASLRFLVRVACGARIYGIAFALFAPVRTVYGNVLNSAATAQALAQFIKARALGRPLKWLKTDHAYPSRAALLEHKKMLGEILVSSGYLSLTALNSALATKPAGLRLGEHLIKIGELDDASVYEALSLQQGLPVSELRAEEVPAVVARALPEHVAQQWRVLPFRVADASLHLATPDVPSLEMSAAVRSFTTLELRFHLMTPEKFETLTRALL